MGPSQHVRTYLTAARKLWLRAVGRIVRRDTGEAARLGELEAAVGFLFYEVSEQRRHLRHLCSEQVMKHAAHQTVESFDYQWRHVGEARYMLGDPEFKETVPGLVLENTGLPAAWFRNKVILDVGCGSGRFTYALAKLGARVTAIDATEGGVEATQRAAAEFGERVVVHKHNVLDTFPSDEQFDLVWCFGVLHHTGATFRGFENIARLVRPNGYLFLMVYGEPRIDHPGEFAQYAEMSRMRRLSANLSYEEKLNLIKCEHPEDVHGWFDAISPHINDIFSYQELESWLLKAGFVDIRRTRDNPNHHLVARKAADR